MRIVIDIPEEFEEHFRQDAFADTLHRLSADAHLIAGNYEQETAIMLIEALRSAIVLPKGHGRLVDVNSFYDDLDYDEKWIADNAPTIIEADTEVEK